KTLLDLCRGVEKSRSVAACFFRKRLNWIEQSGLVGPCQIIRKSCGTRDDNVAEDELPAGARGKRGAKPSGKPTLKTIAQMTGLAVTTISRALNNAPELAQDTRDRVQKIAAEIGYLPDRAALRLKTGRTNVVALILEPDEQSYGFGTSLVTGITEALRDTAYHIVITPLFRNVDPMEPIR